MIKRYSFLLEKMNLLNGATRDYKEEWESDRFFRLWKNVCDAWEK